jgi:O-antigen/teichoic acid export membrane protein
LGKIKRLAGETVLYGLGSILPRGLNFLLVALHTSVFVAAEYGVITKLFTYVAVANVVFIFGMETAYFRFANKPGADEKKVFNLAQTVVVCVSAFCALIILAFSSSVSEILMVPGRQNIVVMIVLIMFIDAIVSIPFSRLRLQRKPLQFAVGKVLNITILIGLNLFFLVYLKLGADVSYVIIANLLANSFYVILFARTLISWRPKYDKVISPQMFSYAYPVMLTGLAGMTNEMFSRMTLDEWLPEDFYPNTSKASALGIFGACYKFSMLMSLAIMAFRYAAEPFFFSQSNEKNSPQLFARINHYFIIVCCVLLLSVSINLDILKHFLRSEEYWQGLNIVPILLLAYLFLGVYYNFSVWFKLTDKTYYGTIITLVGVFITIAGNYFLIPLAGYFGSSLAAMLCYLVMALMCYMLGQKYYPIPYSVGIDVLYILSTTFLVYFINSLTITNQVTATLFHVVVITAYLLMIFLLERKQFRQVQA